MDLLARTLLEKLLIAGEKGAAGRRTRSPSLTPSHLSKYLEIRSLPAKESFETTMRAARAAGAVVLTWDDIGNEEGFIQRVDLVAVGPLAEFLGRVPVTDQVQKAEVAFAPYIERFPVLTDVLERWRTLRSVRTLTPSSVQDWLDAIRALDFARNDNVSESIALPIREASARLFKDSKRIEKLLAPVDILLSGGIDGSSRDQAEVWNELGLFREEHPVRLAGRVLLVRERATTFLDTPYMGLPATTIRRLESTPRLVMTIENQTTFHSEARKRCEEDILLIFTAGMPTPAWRAMYKRLLRDIPVEVPVYHWGDVDEGGFRIAAILAADASSAGHTLRPWSMHPSDVPVELRRPASMSTLSRIRYFAEKAGWHELGEAIYDAKFTAEQEIL